MKALSHFYKALPVPLLSYGISAWGGGSNMILWRGEFVQKDANLAIFRKRLCDLVGDIFTNCKYRLPKRSVVYSLDVALLIFKT